MKERPRRVFRSRRSLRRLRDHPLRRARPIPKRRRFSTMRDFSCIPEDYRPKISHRRLGGPSQITHDTFEKSFQNERQKFQRNAAKYRICESEQYHYRRPLEKGRTFWDNWQIVDRGRKKVESAKEYQPHNPILHPSSVDASRPASGKGHYKNAAGNVNPITAPWKEPATDPDPIISRSCSLIFFRQKDPKYHSIPCGIYDPIRCQWIEEPEDTKLRDSNGYVIARGKLRVSQSCLSGEEAPIVHLFQRRGKKRVPLPSEQGIYDPIKNAWLVLPQNKRICEGRTFAPVSKLQFR